MTSGTIGDSGAQALQKRQLHLERVLARVRRVVFADDRVGVHQRRGDILVDRREARMASRTPPAPDTATPSKPTKCDGPTSDRDVERAPAQQPVRMRGDRT